MHPRFPQYACSRHRPRGMVLLELVIAVIVVGMAGTLLLDRLHAYRMAAEKATMEYTISMLRSVLRMRLAELMIAGRQQESASLVGQNPMRWLEGTPPDYAGEIASGVEPIPGHWYFDTRDATLVYFVRHADGFHSVMGSPPQVRLRLAAVPTQGGALDQGSSDSVRLLLREPYRWDAKQ